MKWYGDYKMLQKPNDTNTQSIFFKYSRKALHYCIAFLALCVICYIYVQGTSLRINRIENTSRIYNQLPERKQTNNSKENKLILLWTKYFSDPNWLPSTRDLQCQVHECRVTSERALLTNSSAILLHWRNVDPLDLPPECDSKSSPKNCPVLVMFNKEAPPNTNPENVRKLDNRINLMASYRRDSDIQAHYGRIVRRHDEFKLPKLNPNRDTVCWLVSNCHTQSNREVYVNKLRRFVNVTIYGKCGDNSCPHSNTFECYKWLSERCKFYLSFENSICKDYSTEKLYYAMMTDMVPIVLGGDDYSRYLPSNSYINVKDYASPEQLANHLKGLDMNETSYMAYFKWKLHFRAVFIAFEWLCDLCAFLHSSKSQGLEPRESMIAWWFDQARCGSL